MKYQLFSPVAIHELGKRDNQEDSMYPAFGQATASDRLFLVCDGMGGHAKGEVASSTVCDAISTYFRTHASSGEPLSDDLLRAAVSEAYVQLDGKDDGSFKKPGTTLTLVALHRGGATMFHIGDSRIYHVRPSERRLLYKSRDHSLVYQLYQIGEISYAEMKTHPQKNVITKAMMPGEDNRVDLNRLDIAHTTDIQPGDYFYLCSDGMLEEMEDDELVAILSSDASDEEKRLKLIEATAGNSDNHTAYLIHLDTITSEAIDKQQPNDEATVKFNALNVRPLAADTQTVAQKDEDVTVVPPAVEPVQPSHPVAPVNSAFRRTLSREKAESQAEASTGKRRMGLWAIFGMVVLLGLGFFAYFHFGGSSEPSKQAEPTNDSIANPKVEKKDSVPPVQEDALNQTQLSEPSQTSDATMAVPPTSSSTREEQTDDFVEGVGQAVSQVELSGADGKSSSAQGMKKQTIGDEAKSDDKQKDEDLSLKVRTVGAALSH